MTFLDAAQAALAAEHGAVYVLAAVGAQTSQTGEPQLYETVRAAYAAHRRQRDDLTALIRTAGADPVPAEVAYRLPQDLGPERVRIRTAREVVAACTEFYAALITESPNDSDERVFAVRTLQMTAVRELALRGTPETLPGSGEYADRVRPGTEA